MVLATVLTSLSAGADETPNELVEATAARMLEAMEGRRVELKKDSRRLEQLVEAACGVV